MRCAPLNWAPRYRPELWLPRQDRQPITRGCSVVTIPLIDQIDLPAGSRQRPAGIPVTAKIRLGYDSDEQFQDILDALSSVTLTEITIHARTKQQGYRPPAHWHQLRRARDSLPYPVIANGELWSPSDISRCRKVSGCNAFMLARGSLCQTRS